MLSQLPNLTLLNIGTASSYEENNSITLKGAFSIAKLTKIQHVGIIWNPIENVGLGKLCSLPKLQLLYTVYRDPKAEITDWGMSVMERRLANRK